MKSWADQNLDIFARGSYVAPSGALVELRDAIDRAADGTHLYTPAALEALAAARPKANATASSRIEVERATTAASLRRLVEIEGETSVVGLNFASAKSVGGGFLGGAKAQEEDLCRNSALYPCLLRAPDYYAANRASGSMIYTDHIIYSPDVPFFRDDAYMLQTKPFLASMITAPAPNRGAAIDRGDYREDELIAALHRRARFVLEVAADRGHRALVLGAWGCGVFRNDPVEVARAFEEALRAMPGAFDRVVLAIHERGAGPNVPAFEARFGAAISGAAR
jgi:uncharacterized protein (TIGR02452 family)